MSLRIAVSCRLNGENQHDFVRALAQNDEIDLYVITDSRNYPDVPELDQLHIYHYLPAWSTRFVPSRFNPLDKREYNRILDAIDPDILLSLGSSKLLFMAPATGFSPSVFLPMGGETEKATGDPYWPTTVKDRTYYRIFYKPLFKDLLQHVDEVWSTAPNINIFQSLNLSSKSFRFFDWGVVDTNEFQPQTDYIEYSNDKSKTIIGSFRRPRGTRLLPSYKTFLDAIGKLDSYRNDFYVVLGGFYNSNKDEKVRELINDKIREYDLDQTITLLDMVPKSEMPKYYSGLDVYINLSHKGLEMTGLGTASKEAMACECAYISYDNPPKDYVIEDGVNGLLVSHQKPHEFAEKLDHLCSDDETRNELGKAARRTVAEKYSISAVNQQVRSACQEILDG